MLYNWFSSQSYWVSHNIFWVRVAVLWTWCLMRLITMVALVFKPEASWLLQRTLQWKLTRLHAETAWIFVKVHQSSGKIYKLFLLFFSSVGQVFAATYRGPPQMDVFLLLSFDIEISSTEFIYTASAFLNCGSSFGAIVFFWVHIFYSPFPPREVLQGAIGSFWVRKMPSGRVRSLFSLKVYPQQKTFFVSVGVFAKILRTSKTYTKNLRRPILTYNCSCKLEIDLERKIWKIQVFCIDWSNILCTSLQTPFQLF